MSIICPKGKGYEKGFEEIDGIAIYRHPQPFEGSGALGYLAEYSWALLAEFVPVVARAVERGFDAIHACNPPDTMFLIGGFYKLFGKKFLFDHHDINPELYEAKFQRRDLFYRLMLALERLTFKTADVCVATNESYRRIAIERGERSPDKVFVVRSGPDLRRLRCCRRACTEEGPPLPGRLRRRDGAAGRHRRAARVRAAHRARACGGTTSSSAWSAAAPSCRRCASSREDLGVADYVTFTGRVPDDELLAMLNTADVCVNPDVANEMNDKSTMNKIMEYMALGKPIVQFDLTEGRVSAQDASLVRRAQRSGRHGAQAGCAARRSRCAPAWAPRAWNG